MATAFLNEIPLTILSGVGKGMLAKLSRLKIYNLQDLLLHLPTRYEDRTQVTPIADLEPGQYTSVEGVVESYSVQFGRRPMLLVSLSDGSSKLVVLRFFNFNDAIQNSFQRGVKVRAFGEIKQGFSALEIIHPEYRIIYNDQPLPLEQSLTPIYPATEGLKQNSLRRLTDKALAFLDNTQIEEILPSELNPFCFSLKEAIQFLHRPSPDVSLEMLEQGKHPAQQRLIFEELLAHNLAMQKLRLGTQQFFAFPLFNKTELKSQFLARLPFQLTNAQHRVINEIEQDLSRDRPMMRLVQGDVGSGKTLVAALVALKAIGNGKQVALMAPTEILAEQHVNNFRHWFEPFNIEVGWLVGKTKGKARQAEIEKIRTGTAKMVIGTHALFQKDVEFADLALVIIDEQHRFGVHQRLMLRQKGEITGFYPHQLIMTATPIPRTLSMTVYADLDTSIIDELPKGRSPITTIAVSEHRRDEVVERVRNACVNEKRQVYWVCALIDESELLEAQAAEVLWQDLSKALPMLKIGLIHGRMKLQEKQQVMMAFKAGALDLLVATTVIEVGVDVPNASLMIIENAERFGLSQLHQLRGRVGRGNTASFCVLMYKPPLGKISQQRLQVLRQSQNGFVISEKDLEIRGPGEVLGTKQAGLTEFKVADLMRDRHLIPMVQHYAKHLISEQPQLANMLIYRWLNHKEIYSQV